MDAAQLIIIYQPLPKASRIQIYIPYTFINERAQLKSV